MPIECYRKILEQADSGEIRDGRNWYKNANLKVEALADKSGYTTAQVAGVVAVLSPMVEWSLNWRSAERLCMGKGKAKGIPGFSRNVKKAKDILSKGALGGVKGPKVEPFYHSLLNPAYETPVIDTQMIAAFWDGVAYRDDFKIVSSSEKRKKPIYDAIKVLASEKKWGVAETQAVIWVTFKRLNGPYANQLKLFK